MKPFLLTRGKEERFSLNEQESKPGLTGAEKRSQPEASRPGPAKGRARWGWLVLLCLVLGVVVFLLLERHAKLQATRGKKGGNAPLVQVSTAVVRQGDIGVYVNALGMVTPLNTVQVRSR